MENIYEVIFCIINDGFSDAVMDAAKECGATGGTVIKARGTASQEAEKLFNIRIQSEKEIVMIIIDKKIKDDVLHSLYREAGLKSEAGGIFFSCPVDDVVGLEEKKIVKK